jgi:hypothetical protein
MSNINTNSINGNFPTPGINQSSQGFRDNFTSIKTNLDTASTEISDIQSKAVVKTALTGTVLNNDMANTLISNAAVQGFRAKTYNLGDNIGSAITINVSKADVQYGTITQNTVVSFGGWAPSGTQSNVQLLLSIANSSAYITFPPTTVDNDGNISAGMNSSARLLEHYFSNVSTVTANIQYTNTVNIPNGVRQLDYNLTTIDCGATLDITPTNRNQKATQIPIRAPLNIGLPGDVPGDICTDGSYIYVCVGIYNGVTTIWGKTALTAVT